MQPFQRFIDALNHELFRLGEWKFSTLGLIKIVALPILAFLFARYVKRFVRLLLNRSAQIDPGVKAAIVAVVYYITLVLGLVVAMDEIGVDVTSLAVFTGAVGVGIGLGLQDFARNFIAGLLMMGFRPIKPGDRVEFSGLSGVVKSIGAYSTVLETVDHAGLLVPNSILLNDRVINRSYYQSSPVLSVTVRLPHTADVDGILANVRESYGGLENFDAHVTAVTEAATEVRFTVPMQSELTQARVSDDVYRRVVAAMAIPRS